MLTFGIFLDIPYKYLCNSRCSGRAFCIPDSHNIEQWPHLDASDAHISRHSTTPRNNSTGQYMENRERQENAGLLPWGQLPVNEMPPQNWTVFCWHVPLSCHVVVSRILTQKKAKAHVSVHCRGCIYCQSHAH